MQPNAVRAVPPGKHGPYFRGRSSARVGGTLLATARRRMHGDNALVTRFRDAVGADRSRRCVCWVGCLEHREPAFALACAVADSGPCHVVMCLDSPARLEPHRPLPPGRQQPLTPEVIAAAEAMLQQLYRREAKTMVLPGDPIIEIRRYAQTHDVGIIVMGSQALAIEHEYGRRLVDDAPCPVLVFVTPISVPRSSTPARGR